MNIAIVGYGIRGKKMAKITIVNFVDNKIIAICDINPEVLKSINNEYPDIQIYDNFDKMFNNNKYVWIY